MTQRKPLSKGSNGTKPVAHAPGQKPKPKRSGVMYQAHQEAKNVDSERNEGPPVAEGTTQPVQPFYETGIESVDSAGPGQCEASDGSRAHKGGCFLTTYQRDALIQQLGLRMMGAQDAALNGLTSLEINSKIEKEAELPLWVSLLTSAAFKLVEIGIGLSIKQLRSSVAGVVHEFAEAGVHGVAEHASSEMLKELHEKTLEGMVAVAVDNAKEQTKTPVVGAMAGDAPLKKAQELNYIDRVKSQLMVTCQTVREHFPAQCDDGQLLALFKSFDNARHTPAAYREMYEAKIERYMATRIKTIGRRSEEDRDTKPFILPSNLLQERTVAWLREPTNAGPDAPMGKAEPHLIYVDTPFPTNVYADPLGAYHGEHAMSLADEGDWRVSQPGMPEHLDKIVRGAAIAGAPQFVGYVEEEFVETALERNEEVWLHEPKSYVMDYSTGQPHLKEDGAR